MGKIWALTDFAVLRYLARRSFIPDHELAWPPPRNSWTLIHHGATGEPAIQ
jgi:hypothetical protein